MLRYDADVTLVRSARDHDNLDNLRSTLSELDAALRQRTAEITRTQSDLAAFRIRYRQEVGLLHEELDDLQREISEAELNAISQRGGTMPPARPHRRLGPRLRRCRDSRLTAFASCFATWRRPSIPIWRWTRSRGIAGTGSWSKQTAPTPWATRSGCVGFSRRERAEARHHGRSQPPGRHSLGAVSACGRHRPPGPCSSSPARPNQPVAAESTAAAIIWALGKGTGVRGAAFLRRPPPTTDPSRRGRSCRAAPRSGSGAIL